MGEVYWATFAARPDGLMWPTSAEAVAPPARIDRKVADEVFGVGSGWQTYGSILAEASGIATWGGDRFPQACDVAELAVAAYARGEGVPPDQGIPVYVRDDVTHKKG
jgi:tRNA threonylcarbamoyladenosine biosynthesis protein TsaB